MNYTTHHNCRANLNVFTLKRSYHINHGGLRLNEEAPELIEDPIVEDFCMLEESDFFPKQSFIDVAIKGTLYTPQGQPRTTMDTAVVVQDRKVALKLYGQRRLEYENARWRFSSPEPFTSIPLSWEEAYGGHDALGDVEGDLCGLDQLGEQTGRDLSHMNLSRYRRNPKGKGFILKLKPEHEGILLPRVEFAHSPIQVDHLSAGSAINWHFMPSPACFDWIHFHWFPRSQFMVEKLFGKVDALLPQRPLPEYDFGFSREDLFQRMAAHDLIRHPRMFNAAHPALQIPNTKKPVEITLYHVSPDQQELNFKVPYKEPTIKLKNPGERKTYKSKASLSQIRINLEERTLTTTWHALIHTRNPVSDENHEKIEYDVQWDS